MVSSPHVAVVGGGVSGLAAAHRLRALLGQAATITVFEQADRIGGKLRTVEFAGRRYDVGAEAFLVRRPEAADLLATLGIADELVHPTAAGATVHADGRTVPLPARTLLGVPASVEAVRDVLSAQAAATLAAEPGLPPVRLDGADAAVGPLLRERLGAEITDRLVEPLLGGVYAGRVDDLGLRATMPTLVAALDAGAGSLLAAANAALPAPPSPGTARPPVFGTLHGGLGSLADRLARTTAARIRLRTAVRGLRLRAGEGSERAWRLELGPASAPEFVDADGVVLAVPAPAARRLLAEVAPVASAGFARIELASVATVALALPPGTELPASSGVLVAVGERHAGGTPFTTKAFTFSSRKWAHLEGGGQPGVVRGSVGRYGEVEDLQRDDDELVAAVRADFAELTGITAAPVDALVTRWGGGLPQYRVGHLDVVASIEDAVAGLPGVAVAGAALHGVGIQACVAVADAAANRVAAHLLAAARVRSGKMGSCPA
jgi:oxygen-dependent protoporphyrinogen oxidase